jgi:hypothetical protein
MDAQKESCQPEVVALSGAFAFVAFFVRFCRDSANMYSTVFIQSRIGILLAGG